jgi:hypothetical protein
MDYSPGRRVLPFSFTQEISMKCLSVLLFTAPLLAQVTLPGGSIPTPIAFQQTYTTGMVGLAANQNARLNVFNLNPVAATTSTTSTPPANCAVALEFYDNKGGMVSRTTVPNFAPGQSAFFDLPYSSLTTESLVHAEIRGVVVINPTPASGASTAVVGNCSVITTLEIFDATTGSTVALTSDTRPVAALGYAGFLSAPIR